MLSNLLYNPFDTLFRVEKNCGCWSISFPAVICSDRRLSIYKIRSMDSSMVNDKFGKLRMYVWQWQTRPREIRKPLCVPGSWPLCRKGDQRKLFFCREWQGRSSSISADICSGERLTRGLAAANFTPMYFIALLSLKIPACPRLSCTWRKIWSVNLFC